MHKRQKTKKLFGYVLIVCLICIFIKPDFTYAGYADLKDTISDSSFGAAADHTIIFTTSMDIGANGYYEVTLDPDFGDILEADCAGPNVTTSTTTDTVRCTYSSSPGAATTTKILIYDVTNPLSADSLLVSVESYNVGDTLLEAGQAVVAIVDNVSMSAHIESSLDFSMISSSTPMYINGIPLTGSSTDTTLPFGTLSPVSSSTLGHTIGVTTNAPGGFSCTVQQDSELRNGAGDTINSFDNSPDGTGSTTPHVWNPPVVDITKDNTYGHFGVTTDDFTLTEHDYSGSRFTGLHGTNPSEIAYHNGPSEGTVLGSGLAHVAYSIQISALQEAGDYTSTINYVCTCNF